jgi:hypothetical protein
MVIAYRLALIFGMKDQLRTTDPATLLEERLVALAVRLRVYPHRARKRTRGAGSPIEQALTRIGIKR